MPKVTTGAEPIAGRLRERLRTFVVASGERAASDALEVNRQTIARAIAGFKLRRGTVLQLEIRMAELEAASAVPGDAR